MSPNEILTWLASSSGAIVAFSWLAEQFDGWHNLSPKQKEWYSFAGSSAIGLAAWATLTYVSAATLSAIAFPLGIVAGVFVLKFVKDAVHKVTKKEKDFYIE